MSECARCFRGNGANAVGQCVIHPRSGLFHLTQFPGKTVCGLQTKGWPRVLKVKT